MDFVSPCNVAADIGCDHGHVTRALIEEGRAAKVIACDISIPSLEKAKKMAEQNGLDVVVETRWGDGLEPLGTDEAQVIVIAGMGGILVRDILRKSIEKAKNADLLVLCAHRNVTELRRWLCENGFAIVDEALAQEGNRFYQIVCARCGFQVIEDDFYLEVGRKLIENNDPLLTAFLEMEIAGREGIVAKAVRGKDSGEQVEKLKRVVARMKEVVGCLQM